VWVSILSRKTEEEVMSRSGEKMKRVNKGREN
jgi:hypothetical protein